MRGDEQCALHTISEQYVQFLSCLRVVPELTALPATLDQTTCHIGKLLRVPRSGTHPLRHLLLILWLFGNWNTFWRAYMDDTPQCTAGLGNGDGQRLPSKHRENQRQAILQLITEQSYPVSRAAKTVGIDSGTAAAWAAAAGIPTPNHSAQDSDTRRRLINELRQGIEKADAAAKYHLSVQSITRLLRTEVGLHLTWHEARHELRRATARHCWQQAHERYPDAGIKALRLLEPGSYAWLYRNDRDWLNEQTTQLPKPNPSNYAHTDWAARDAHLCALVQQARLRLSIDKPTQRLTLQTIYQAIPALKPMLGKLDRLPLTRQSLEAAVDPGHKPKNQSLSTVLAFTKTNYAIF